MRKDRRKTNNQSTTILDTVNEISTPEVSLIQDRYNDGGPMSSTMKSDHHRSSSRDKFNDSNRSYRRDSGTYSNNSGRSYSGGYRRINKYQHHTRDPKNNIQFEYAVKNGD